MATLSWKALKLPPINLWSLPTPYKHKHKENKMGNVVRVVELTEDDIGMLKGIYQDHELWGYCSEIGNPYEQLFQKLGLASEEDL